MSGTALFQAIEKSGHIVLAFGILFLLLSALPQAAVMGCKDKECLLPDEKIRIGAGHEKRLEKIPQPKVEFEGTAYEVTDNHRTGPFEGTAYVQLNRTTDGEYVKGFRSYLVDEYGLGQSVPVRIEALVPYVETFMYWTSNYIQSENGTWYYGPPSPAVRNQSGTKWKPIVELSIFDRTNYLRISANGLDKYKNYDWKLEYYRAGNKIKEYPWAWWNNSFGYKQEANQTFGIGSTVLNVTLPFNLSTTSLISAGKMQANCSDLNIVNQTETTNFYQYVENRTCNTGNTVAWAQVDYTRNGVNQNWAYYGYNTSVTYTQHPYSYAADPSITWYSDMSENTTNSNIVNSRLPSYNVSCGSPISDFKPASFGYGFNVTTGATTCNIASPLSRFVGGNGSFTWEAFVYYDGAIQTGGGVQVRSLIYDYGGGYLSFLDGSAAVGCNGNASSMCMLGFDTAVRYCTLTGFTPGNWHHVAWRSSGANTPYNMTCWFNGHQQTSTNWNGFGSVGGVGLRLMQGITGGQPFLVDSVLLSNESKSDDWIRARAYSMLNSSITYGPEETVGGAPIVSFVSPTPANTSWVNETWAYINVTVQNALAGESCFLHIGNSSGFSSVNMSSSFDAAITTLTCFFNQSAAQGLQQFNVTHVGSANTTSSNREYTFPYYAVYGFDESAGSSIAINASITNGTDTSVTSVSATRLFFHSGMPIGPTSITGFADGYVNRTFTWNGTTDFQVYRIILAQSGTTAFYTFQVRTAGGLPVTDAFVTIQRTVAGSLVNITSSACDGSGICVFELVTGATYTIFANSATYGSGTITYTASITPTTIILGQITSQPGYSTDFRGMYYNFDPTGQVRNSTYVTFNFTTAATVPYKYNFSDYRFCVSWQNGSVAGCANGSTYNGSTLSITAQADNGDFMRATWNFTVNADSQVGFLEGTRLWPINALRYDPGSAGANNGISLFLGVQQFAEAFGASSGGWLIVLLLGYIVSLAVGSSLGLGGAGSTLLALAVLGVIVFSTGVIPIMVYAFILLVAVGAMFYFRG